MQEKLRLLEILTVLFLTKAEYVTFIFTVRSFEFNRAQLVLPIRLHVTRIMTGNLFLGSAVSI